MQYLSSFSACAALFLLVIAFVVSPQRALGQQGVDLSLAAVEPYSAQFDYFVHEGEGAMTRAGRWTDNVSVVNDLLIRTVQRYNNDGQADLLRAVIVDRATIAPIRIQQRFGPALASVYQAEFRDGMLTQILIGDALTPARVATADMETPVVETGLQAVFVLSLINNGPGEVTVSTYETGASPRTISKTYHLAAEEQVEAMGTTLTAWRVEDRASQWTYWVRKTKPYIVKVMHPMPGGKMSTSIVSSFE